MPIVSLHHVTATVDAAQDDLDFCLGALGLRLVKKTVNFDNHHVYHFYYGGDERGTPGTIWTTFPYKDHGVRVGTKGAGQVTLTSFSVPSGSLDAWKRRLRDRGVAVQDVAPRFGEDVIQFSDSSGLVFEMIATAGDARTPWTGGAGASTAIRGLHSVTITVREPAATLELMTGLLGYTVVDETAGRIRVAVGGDGPGHIIDIVHDERAEPAVNGLGTVHHVAMAITSEEEQLALRGELIAAGRKVTEVRDRCYFKSIYFREPGNVLFEVATMQPGFACDEDVAELGRGLKLPPWEEGNRADIEEHLAAIKLKT
jgi:glyoxalase family protein